jgi:hypothetical protein
MKYKRVLVRNFEIGVVLICIFYKIVDKIQFPSSLLPEKNIFFISYYIHEFSEIFSGLQSFTDGIAIEIRDIFIKNMIFAIGIILISFIGLVIILLLFSSQENIETKDRPSSQNAN